jgi:hypothetical protein
MLGWRATTTATVSTQEVGYLREVEIKKEYSNKRVEASG